jgi:hypothetical protein
MGMKRRGYCISSTRLGPWLDYSREIMIKCIGKLHLQRDRCPSGLEIACGELGEERAEFQAELVLLKLHG